MIFLLNPGIFRVLLLLLLIEAKFFVFVFSLCWWWLCLLLAGFSEIFFPKVVILGEKISRVLLLGLLLFFDEIRVSFVIILWEIF